jgi:hypothetical protein
MIKIKNDNYESQNNRDSLSDHDRNDKKNLAIINIHLN